MVEYVIAAEEHADGTPHIHAWVKLESRVYFKPRLFDLPDHHGNYQVAKSWKAVRQYITKGGDYITNLDIASA